MSVATIAGHQVHVDGEGFLTEYDEWDEALADQLTVAGNPRRCTTFPTPGTVDSGVVTMTSPVLVGFDGVGRQPARHEVMQAAVLRHRPLRIVAAFHQPIEPYTVEPQGTTPGAVGELSRQMFDEQVEAIRAEYPVDPARGQHIVEPAVAPPMHPGKVRDCMCAKVCSMRALTLWLVVLRSCFQPDSGGSPSRGFAVGHDHRPVALVAAVRHDRRALTLLVDAGVSERPAVVSVTGQRIPDRAVSRVSASMTTCRLVEYRCPSTGPTPADPWSQPARRP
ncbi:hypothetical protein [Actinocatenispora rupis]|uniref:Uncharacterized protein n=1 Tax=Actinocatenispora rupis TaxID=519421 RepID=A0A8J3J190_9ACTN|nr:hypothetical protein [Actinocatenispora rupis]GID12368.1 hypothetical protein Aru02nite_32570 [Actinocatenispora rupis]